MFSRTPPAPWASEETVAKVSRPSPSNFSPVGAGAGWPEMWFHSLHSKDILSESLWINLEWYCIFPSDGELAEPWLKIAALDDFRMLFTMSPNRSQDLTDWSTLALPRSGTTSGLASSKCTQTEHGQVQIHGTLPSHM